MIFSLSAGSLIPSLESEIEAWAQAHVGRRPDRVYLSALKTFVRQGIVSGWWNALTGIFLFNAPTVEGALINLKNPSHRATISGAMFHSPYSGIASDGVSGYVDTGLTVPQLPGVTLNSHTLLIYSQGDIPGATTGEAGAATGGANWGMRCRSNVVMSIWSNSINLVANNVTSARGLNGFVRNDSGSGFTVKNDTTVPWVNTAVTFPSSKVYFGRLGASSSFSTNQLAFGFYGGALTKDQCANLYLACSTFLQSLDTLVPNDEPDSPTPNCFAYETLYDVTPSLAVANASNNGSGAIRLVTTTPHGCTSGDRVTVGNVGGISAATGRWEVNVINSTTIDLVGSTWSGTYTSGGSVITIEILIAGVPASDAITNLNVYTSTSKDVTWSSTSSLSVTNATNNAGKIRLVVTAHGLSTGDQVVVSGVGGVSAANGTWVITVIDSNTIELNGSTWSGTYTSGGTVLKGNAYLTLVGDLGRTLKVTTGIDIKAIRMYSPVTAGTGALQVIQKMDRGTGSVTILDLPTPIVLSKQYDIAILVSDGTNWISTPGYARIQAGYIGFPQTSGYTRAWGGAALSTRTNIDIWDFLWGDRGLGPVEGEVTAWAKKRNDTNGAITTTLGVGCGIEFNTYDLAAGATLVKQAYSLGYLPRNDTTLTVLNGVYRAEGWGWLDIADYYGYDTTGWAQYVDAGDTAALTTDINIETGPVMHWKYASYKNQQTFAVSNAINNGSGLIRIVTATPHGATTGDTVIVRGIGGVPTATGSWVVTVIDSTTIDLVGSTFGSSSFISDGSVITGINRADTLFDRIAVTGTFQVARDIIILGQGRISTFSSAHGVLIDCEMDDDRPPEHFEALMCSLAELCHAKGYKFGISAHQINTGSGVHMGWTKENANRILTRPDSGAADFLNIIMSFSPPNGDQAAWLQGQLDFLRGPNDDLPIPYNKLMLQLGIGGPGQEMKRSYAQIAHDLVVNNKMRGYIIVPIYATRGGALSREPNQVVATLLGLPTT